MVKKIVKAILWRMGLLERVQEFFWKPVEMGVGVSRTYFENNLPEFSLNFDDSEINISFAAENKEWVPQKDYLLTVNRSCIIEPVRGLIIISNKEFLSQSRVHQYVFPDRLKYLKCKYSTKKIVAEKLTIANIIGVAVLGKTPTIVLEEAVHMDGYLSVSYYHMFRDMITSLGPLNKAGLLAGRPLIIGHDAYHAKHFQWILNNREWFRNLNWHVLDGKTYIRVNKLYKFVSLIPDNNLWKQARDILQPPVVADPQRKVFLYRAGNFGRTIKNMSEIRPVLEKYGFDLVDTGSMTVAEQMDVFADIRYLIAIHGAGITNILFCNPEKFSLLEILPGREKLNTTFYWMAEAMYCKYDALLTEDMDAKRHFRLVPQVLEQHIIKLLAS